MPHSPIEIDKMQTRIIADLTAPGASFEIVQQRVGDRLVRAFARADQGLAEVLDRASRRFEAEPLLIHPDGVLTYGALFASGNRLAARLLSEYAIMSGDRVGIAMRNRPEWFIAFVAIIRAGGVPVIFNSRSSASELDMAIEDVPCKLILADRDRAARWVGAGGATTVVDLTSIDLGRSFVDVVLPSSSAETDDPAVILFTSGTTGRSKGVVLTGRNFGNLIQNMALIGASSIKLAAEIHGVSPRTLEDAAPLPSTLLVYPMFHISGVMMLLRTLENGGKLVILRRWDAPAALKAIHDHQVTALSGPPPVIGDLLDQPDAASHLGTISSVGVGGQATPLNLSNRVRKALPHAAQTSGWGQTETMGSLTLNGSMTFSARPESCGTAFPVVELRVLGDDGQDLPAGEVGEFVARSPMLMHGYFNAPDANAAAFVDDWYRTGDVGYIDDHGYVYLLDRTKDMVISSGENIYCAEVEQALTSDPSIREVAVFGAPDERLGERVVAIVNLQRDVSRTAHDIQCAVREKIADYKVPAEILFSRDPLPRNTTGKIDKIELRRNYFNSRAGQV